MNKVVKNTGGRMGRPPLDAEKKKGHSVAFRPRSAIRARLQAAAAASGRSVSEEIEYRVEQSFQIESAFGAGVRLDILQSIALTLKHVERLTGRSNYDTHADFIEVRKAVNGTLNQFMAILPDRSEGAALADAIKGTGRLGQAVADVNIMAMDRELGSDKPSGLNATPQQLESLVIYVRELMRADPELTDDFLQKAISASSNQGNQTND